MRLSSSDNFSGKVTIPVFYDSEFRYGGHSLFRYTYFSIESVTPSIDWTLQVNGVGFPVFLLGLSCIICGPVSGEPSFTSIESIDELFDVVESQDELFVDINDIWLPSFIFESVSLYDFMLSEDINPVPRLSEDIFSLAYLFREDKISIDAYFSAIKGLGAEATFYIDEAKAFKQWEAAVIKRTSERYHSPDYEKYRLDYKGDE